MINYPSAKKTIAVFTLLLCTLFSYAQLPDFTLTVTPTPQTCLGNGALSFTVSGTDPDASIDYSVYLLPDTATPITVTTDAIVNGLSAGNYLVTATQSLGALSNTSSANATITNEVTTLTYNLIPTKVQCGNDGAITVNVLTGNAASYEILSGPLTVPEQVSNVFNNLPEGLYSVRVFDNCGEAVVVTIQVVQDTTAMLITSPVFFGGELPNCNTITVGNNYVALSGNSIFFPLTFQYSVYPPGGGAPTIITENVPTGSLTNPNLVTTTIPFYNDQEYYYDILVTDVCGNTFIQDNNIVNQGLSFENLIDNEGCDDNSLTIQPRNFVGPITINFDSAPAGFDPLDYNANHPNFNGEAEYDADDLVPYGSYTVTIADACGRSYTEEFEITAPEVQPQVTIQTDCGSDDGNVIIEINARIITDIVITAAPAAYGTVPDNVTDLVDDEGVFAIVDIPLGDYTFVITDSCGVEYTEEVEVEVVGSNNLAISLFQRPGCEEGFGSIRLNASGDFEVVTLTNGPVAFSTTYPIDVSENIASNGGFYMNSLPEGSYSVSTIDNCGIVRERTFDVTGYEIAANDVTVLQYCGSFQVDVDHFSNGNYIQSFWLQRYDEATDTWGDPETGTAYESGLPNDDNSDSININASPDDLPFYAATGDFRVIKTFFTYASGTAFNSLCFDVIDTFTFTGAPVITNVYSFPCADDLTEVALEVEGVAPFAYSITSKNGEPFLIDNGTSNIFSGIEPADYNFRVTDDCGNILNAQFSINAVDPLVVSPSGFCDGEESTLSVQPLSFLTYEWYEESDPDTILSNTNILTFPSFNAATDAGTYFVNIMAANDSSCMNQLLEYEVAPTALPNAGEDVDDITLCNEGATINLADYLTAPHDVGGTWEDTNATGALTDNIFDTDGILAGTYTFKYTVNGLCDAFDEALITVTLNDIPDVPVVEVVPPLCEGETIQLSVTPVAGASYQWAGPNGFTATTANPVIADATLAASGEYSVTATANGCTSNPATVAVIVNSIPDFEIQGETALCEGQSTIITVAPQNFIVGDVTFEWYFEGELLTEVTSDIIEIFDIGNYEVLVKNATCETLQPVIITQNTVGFDVVLEDGCNDFEYVISIANIDEMAGSQFQWSGPEGYNYIGEEAVITNLATGEYMVTITNPDGCSVEAAVVVDNTACSIPRGISPNNDGYNQNFDLSNLDVRDLQIFNRYGLQVYEKVNYSNEWYGQSDKGELPTGTYFYVVTLSAGKKVTGWVYLQREAR